MSVNITVDAGEAIDFAPSIAHLPSEVEVKRPAGHPLPLIFIPLLLLFLNAFLSSVIPGFALQVSTLAGLALAGAGWLWWRNNGKPHLVRFESDGVTVDERWSLGSRRWRARYDEYDGVVMRRVAAPSPTGRTTYEIIELRHANPKKTLPLYAARSRKEPAEQWHRLARLFGLPALESKEDL